MVFPDVLPHGDVEQVVDGVYCVRGSVNMGRGIRVPRIMTLVVDDAVVTVFNSVRLNERGEKQIRDLGTVKHVVKLGYFHGMDDPYYLDKFDAEFWALPKGTRRKDPDATKTLGDHELPISDATVFAFERTKYPEAALLLKRAGGVLLACDSVQHWPDTEGCSVPAKVATRVMGFTKHTVVIGGPWKKGMTREGETLKPDFERLAALPFDKLIAGHARPLMSGAQDAVKATVAASFG